MSAGDTVICPVAAMAASVPRQVAIRSSAGDITYGEWHERIAYVELALRAAGVVPGSRVGLCRPDGETLLTHLIALFRIGAVACPVNPAFPDGYREDLLARLDCALVVGERVPARVYTPPTPMWHLDEPATIIFTSGSTGSPKAAVLSLRNHLEGARRSNENIALAAGDCWLLSLPMHHVAGFGVLFRCLAAGAAVALPESGAALFDSMTSVGATHVSLVARQLALLLDSHVAPPSLKAILLGGSAIPAPLLDRAFAAGLPVHTSYGMTETASQIAATPPGASREALASSGLPLAPDTVRIGGTGTIEVKGPTRFLGYWESGTISRPFDSEGWFTTSDRGHFDDDGFLHVTGRKDNVFIAGGENIQPEEIERALLALAGVAQAIVVPAPHPEFGATVVAFVECTGTLDATAIQGALRAVLPAFKVPRHVLPWPAGLAAGMKVSRGEFAKRAAAALGALGIDSRD